MAEIKSKGYNRLEIIDHTRPLESGGGRTVVVGGPAYKEADNKVIEISVQDEGRTLKIFITEREEDEKV